MTLALSRDLLWLFAPFVFSIASHASPFFWLVLVHVPTGRGQRCSFFDWVFPMEETQEAKRQLRRIYIGHGVLIRSFG